MKLFKNLFKKPSKPPEVVKESEDLSFKVKQLEAFDEVIKLTITRTRLITLFESGMLGSWDEFKRQDGLIKDKITSLKQQYKID